MTYLRVRVLVLGIAIWLTNHPAHAQMFCSAPEPPYCIDAYGTFDDEWAFGRCRAEVEAYIDEVNEYAQCLEQERRVKLQEAEETVSRFNCKANGRIIC